MVTEDVGVSNEPPYGLFISLTSSELRKLRRLARNPKANPTVSIRARAILLAAQAVSNEVIARRLNLSAKAVLLLKDRFTRCRFDALRSDDELEKLRLQQELRNLVISVQPDPIGFLMLAEAEKSELERTVRATTSEQRAVLRAKAILLASSGRNNSAISAILGCDIKTVRKWRARFIKERMDGLYDLSRSGRPRKFTASHRHDMIAMILQAPPPPFSTWTLEMAAQALTTRGIVKAISLETISRWLRTADVKPHRCKYWLNSNDPDFKVKMDRVLDLYMNPPKNCRVICIDEKTCIQAVERRYPDQNMRSGRIRRKEFEYVRHGTVHLIAAFDVQSGAVYAECVDKNNSEAFLLFLCRLRQRYPNEALHFILDNGTTHRSRRTGKFFARHRWLGTPVYLPTHASWLNQIEIWFSVLARQALKNLSVNSREQLIATIYAYVDHHNRKAKPYKWTKTGDACTA